jgi:diadenosine tetraphosphate (Ap4A) HIT family hydrolase
MDAGELMAYDSDNIFAKILRGEVPCKKIFENDYAMAFHDVAPDAPVHILVVPKGPYQSYTDFMTNAKDEEILGFFKAVQIVAHGQGVGDAFRMITNNGEPAGQSVHHFHVHILGGKPLGRLVAD